MCLLYFPLLCEKLQKYWPLMNLKENPWRKGQDPAGCVMKDSTVPAWLRIETADVAKTQQTSKVEFRKICKAQEREELQSFGV